MPTLEPPATAPGPDELAQLEPGIARRADDLLRHDAGRHPARDFQREADDEIRSPRLRAPAA